MTENTIEANKLAALAVSDATKVHTFNHVVEHLTAAAQNDPRARERARATLALRTIKAWATHKESIQ